LMPRVRGMGRVATAGVPPMDIANNRAAWHRLRFLLRKSCAPRAGCLAHVSAIPEDAVLALPLGHQQFHKNDSVNGTDIFEP
jgi:hypothetical protein